MLWPPRNKVKRPEIADYAQGSRRVTRCGSILVFSAPSELRDLRDLCQKRKGPEGGS